MEWKWGAKSFCNHDIDWLSEFTRLHPSCEGYAVCYNPRHQPNPSFAAHASRTVKSIRNG